jgi:hypothetical protein
LSLSRPGDRKVGGQFCRGAYPPLRGTLLKLDEQEMPLYIRGSVEFFSTYPGMYVPQPLALGLEVADSAAKEFARGVGANENELKQHPVRRSRADHHPRSAPGRQHPEVRRPG